ncbi:hypothetical protein Poly24_31740 [Rosistilla carotiformis]|uniref:Response regulatory domain-containing protein n=1 Tax=Rosistilla carotiformis TaxID=2528017 RepID=A0A518JVA4_9BACT|nr:hypothetical protein [Rosistilla carotiformis]QDV69458.1 hypothetical protein Poly24_31740 [Rosistilla carotiformis]
MKRHFLIVVIVWIFVAPPAIHAQDPFAAPPGGADPFGGGDAFGAAPMPAGDAPFGAPAAAADASGAPEIEPLPDPLVLELQRYSQGDNQELALAIRGAVQISDWNQVAAFLDILNAKPLSDADAAVVANTIRANYLLRIQQHPELSDAQRAVIGKVIAGARKYAEDRNRIGTQIKRLESTSPGERLDAISQLRSGGLAAVAELAAAYVSDPPLVARPQLLDVLGQFDDQGPLALRQFALYGKAAARGHALQALVALDVSGSMPDLVSAYHGENANETERSAAEKGFAAAGLRGIPSSREAEIYLSQRLQRAIDLASRATNDGRLQRIWQLDEAQKALQWQDVPQHVALAREAADAATRYRRLKDSDPEAQVAAELADLSYRLMTNPYYGSEADFAIRYGKQGPSQDQIVQLQKTLAAATQQRNEYAAIAAIRLLKQTATSKLMLSNGAAPTLLVETTMHSTPRVRYEAGIAAAEINYRGGYSGSSDLLHRWLEMSALKRRPTALILEARKHLTRDKLSWLESLGYDVEVVGSVADLLRRIEAGGDIQLLLATSQPYDRQITETVDLIRRRPLGGEFPILIYCQPSKTLWDEDLREPILDRSEKIIVDVAGSESAIAAAEEPNETGLPRVRRTEIYQDTSLGERFRALRARHAVQEERIRIQQSLGVRWPAPLAVVEEITSPQGLGQMIRDLNSSLPMPAMTSNERRLYVDAAMVALARVANPDEPNNPYDFRSHEQELTSAIQAGGFSTEGLTLLSTLGTPNSQLTLANLVDSMLLPLSVRQAAAQAFAASVQRFGTRIDRESVARQYERYNAAAEDSDRAALGVILDAMEQRANATSR